MDDRFYHSFLPPEVKVCGHHLTTFSLWHHLVLSAVNSPIALGGEVITIPDLLAAVRVCRLRYGKKSISPGIRDAIWKWRLTRNPKLFRREAEKFYRWMELQCSPPKFMRTDSHGGTHKGVERGSRCLGLACSLMYRGGIPEADAWDCNLGKAMWLDAQFAQIEGLPLRFLDDEDLVEEEIDLSTMSDAEAMEKFTSELPDGIAQATFEHWKSNIKVKVGMR